MFTNLVNESVRFIDFSRGNIDGHFGIFSDEILTLGLDNNI